MTDRKLDPPIISLRRDTTQAVSNTFNYFYWNGGVQFQTGEISLQSDVNVIPERTGVYELSFLISTGNISTSLADRVGEYNAGAYWQRTHWPIDNVMDHCSGSSLIRFNLTKNGQLRVETRWQDTNPSPNTMGGSSVNNCVYSVRYLGTQKDLHIGTSRWDTAGTSTTVGVGTRVQHLEVSLSGQASTSGVGVKVKVGVVSASGTSTTAGTGTKTRAAEASIAGEAATAGTPAVRRIAAASIAGESDVSAGASLRARGTVVAAGESTVAGTGVRVAAAVVSISGEAATSATAVRYRTASASIAGEATVAGTGLRRRTAIGTTSGEATTVAAGLLRARATVSIEGEATTTGTAIALQGTGGSASISFSTAAQAVLIVTSTLPSVSRPFSERLSELRPLEGYQFGCRGDASVNNTMLLSGPGTLARSPSYSGPDYTLAGPADTGASPVQLGFRPGDKVRLIGPAGGEPNDGKEYTLLNPTTMHVMEAMVYPDATEYEFVVLRRVS